jgi:2-C-methyl-D-erythritol 4-phosphate cytidylyltransferase
MSKSVIVVAGGSGSRMGSLLPKQFMPLSGRPLLMWTIERFISYDPGIEIIVVLPAGQIDEWKQLCERFKYEIPHLLAAGGENRYQSARNGFEMVTRSALTAVHDGVRPLVSVGTIRKCFEIAEQSGNAIPCVSLIESLREINSEGSKILSRDNIRIIQTPQVFSYEQLEQGYAQNFDPCFTDDATVVEKLGFHINLVEGNRENIKITTPSDLLIAEKLLEFTPTANSRLPT